MTGASWSVGGGGLGVNSGRDSLDLDRASRGESGRESALALRASGRELVPVAMAASAVLTSA